MALSLKQLLDPARPFQAVYSVYDSEAFGYLLGAYVVEVHDTGQMSLRYQRLLPENIGSFAHGLQPHDHKLVEQLAELSTQRLFKTYGQKASSIKAFLERFPNHPNRALILEGIERKLVKALDLLQGHPLYLMSKDGYPAWRELSWAEEQAKVTFVFNRLPRATYYAARVEVGAETLDLQASKAALITHQPGVLLADRQLIRLQPGLDGKKLKPFLTKTTVTIPKDQERTYFERFLVKLLEEHPVELNGDLALEEVDAPPAFTLILDRAGEGFLRFSLKVAYGGQQLEPTADGAHEVTLKEAGGVVHFRRVKRQPQTEAKILEAFRELRRDDQAMMPTSFALPEEDALAWYLDAKLKLEELGIALVQALPNARYWLQVPHSTANWTETPQGLLLNGGLQMGPLHVTLADVRLSLMKGKPMELMHERIHYVVPNAFLEPYRHLLEVAQETPQGLTLKAAHRPLVEATLSPETAERKADWSSPAAETLPPPPVGLRATLRDYQVNGYAWLTFLQRMGVNGLLADDMGLGKTLQTLAVLLAEKERGAMDRPSLVVCPNSLLFNWRAEARRFAPDLRVGVYYGPKRDKSLSEWRGRDLILTTYGTVRQDIEQLRKHPFHYVVLDESQTIKNREAKVTQAVYELDARHRLSLTGTPIENATTDLWSQMHFLNPGLLGTEAFFDRYYAQPIERGGHRGRAQQLRRLIRPLVLRRTKEQVAHELPESVEQVIYCDLTPEQRELYEANRKLYYKTFFTEAATQLQKQKLQILASLMRLRQIAIHPGLVDPQLDTSEKFEEAINTIAQIVGSGSKVLVFSQFVKMLRLLAPELQRLNIPFSYLDGSTKDREGAVRRFQEDPDCQVFLMSLKAGGVGLNLTAAQYVLLLDPWWNPAVEQQAIARAHRIGQVHTVFSYKYITRGTIEEKILKLQRTKKALASDLIRTDAAALKALTYEDLKALFE